MRAVLKAASPRDRALIALLYYFGLRVSEPLALRPADVGPEKVSLHRTKGSISRAQAMPEEVRRALGQWEELRSKASPWLFPGRDGRHPMTTRGARLAVRRALLGAGVQADLAHPHALKHSIATHMVARGVSVFDVQHWLGHVSLNSTGAYIERPSDETVDRQVLDQLR